MLRKHEFVINELTRRTLQMITDNNLSGARLFYLNGCNHYMVWTSDQEISFGSGEIEVVVNKDMNAEEIRSKFAAYINSQYSNRIEYSFESKVKTMVHMNKYAKWFNMWKS